MTNDLKYYTSILSMNYHDAVSFLLKKYGPSADNYFKEKSYQRFLNGEIKSITKGNVSRTNDGLYCHHIEENHYLNLAQLDFLKQQRPPFFVQEKEQLVYCDLIEHLLLHTLITKETDGEFGFPGLQVFLVPKAVEWFIDKKIPTRKWEKNCYQKAYLEKEELETLIDQINYFLQH